MTSRTRLDKNQNKLSLFSSVAPIELAISIEFRTQRMHDNMIKRIMLSVSLKSIGRLLIFCCLLFICKSPK